MAPTAEGLALLMMLCCMSLQVFFAAVGASANVPLVIRTAPILFCWSFIALAGHLLLLLGLGKLAGFSRKELLLASNANIGGGSGVECLSTGGGVLLCWYKGCLAICRCCWGSAKWPGSVGFSRKNLLSLLLQATHKMEVR
jgi:hypothetical protein